MSNGVVISNQLSVIFSLPGNNATYQVVEEALVGQEFTDYSISRQPYSDHTDMIVTLSPPLDPETNMPVPFDAEDALSKLATAAGAFAPEL